MNKKALVKLSFVGLFLILLIAGFFLLFLPLTSSNVSKDVYFVGDKIKIDLDSGCKVRVETPDTSYVLKSDGDLVLRAELVGTYVFHVSSCSSGGKYIYEVISSVDKSPVVSSSKSNSQLNVTISEEEFSEPRIVVGRPVQRTVDVEFDGDEARVIVPKYTETVAVYVEAESVDEDVMYIDYSYEREFSVSSVLGAMSGASREKTVKVQNVGGDVKLVYSLEAPTKEENLVAENEKEVIVSAPDELNYENVLAYTQVPEIAKKKEELKVYWNEGGQELDFVAFDNDLDGYIDYVEWIVPHLSRQSFRIILVSKAEHLDQNLNFIESVYSEVVSLDDNWSPVILDGEYVRVTFEQNLTTGSDITIFPRVVSGNPKIEIYEGGSSLLISEFSHVYDGVYNRKYLSLAGSQDVFDLKIVGGSVSFDHIVDPPVDPPRFDNFEVVSPWNWTQSTADDCDWSRNADNDGTPSGNTGPELDHTIGTIAGHFLFTEATSGEPCAFDIPSNIAILESPEFDATTYNLTFQFWFHMFGGTGTQMGDLYLDVNDTSGWTNIWSQIGRNQTAQGDPWLSVVRNLGSYDGTIKLRLRGDVGTAYTSDMSIDDLNVTGRYKDEPPTNPTSFECDSGSCDSVVNDSVDLNCSGSVDPNGDPILYVIEKTVSSSDEITTSQFVSVSENGTWSSETTVWTKETGAGCAATWTGNSGWTTAEFRTLIDGDKNDFGNYDSIRYNFCAGTDEGLQVLNVSTCWINSAAPGATDTCTDSLTTNTGEGITSGWYYTEIAAGSCEYTSWMDYDWNGSRNYFVHWGTLDGVGIDGNRYVSGCSDTDQSRVQNSVADVMSPNWLTGEVFENYNYDINSIEGRTLLPSTDGNSTYTSFSSLLGDNYDSLNNITIIVSVDSYNPEASVNDLNSDPDLWLEVYNGTGWYVAGALNLGSIYVGSGLQTTDRNFTKIITDSAVLNAWRYSGNQTARIKGVLLDFNDSSVDMINYTAIHVTPSGAGWEYIGNHTNTTVFTWDTSQISDREGIDFRCEVRELDGLFFNSSKVVAGASLNIDHTAPVIDFTTGTLDNGADSYLSYFFVNVSINETNEANVTFYLYNSSGLVNETTYLAGNRTINFTGLLTDIYYYNVTVIDLVGYVASTSTRSLNVDVDAPLIDYGSGTPLNNTNLSVPYLFFNVSVTEANEKNITFSLYDSSGSLLNQTWYTAPIREINFTGLADADYYYNVTVYDVGNRSNSTLTQKITIDSGIPYGELLTPINETLTNNTIQNLTVNVSDSTGVDNVTLNIFNESNALINQTNIIVGGSLQAIVGVIYEFLYDGIFKWFYTIYDVAGNIYSTGSNTLIIDTTAPNLSIENMLNFSGDSDGYIQFNYNLSDEYSEISNCSLILNETLDQIVYSVPLDTSNTIVKSGLGVGRYNWSLLCYDEAGNANQSGLRYFDVIIASAFTGLTTDLSQVNTSNITNLILERPSYGRIEFNSPVNLSYGANLNQLVSISSEFADIDTTTDSRLNQDATIYFYNLDYVFDPVIWRDGVICTTPDCIKNYYTGGNLSFNVTAFSNYSLTDNSYVTIWDDTDPDGGSNIRYAGDSVLFEAEYLNISDDDIIIGAGVLCNITFDEGTYEMYYNSTLGLHQYNRSFDIYGTYDWEVYCDGSSQGFEPVTVSDEVLITTLIPTVSGTYGYRVQSNQTQISSISQLIPIDTVNLSHTFILSPFYYATGQRVGGTTTSHDNADYTITFQDSSNLNVTRTNNAYDITTTWQIVEALDEEFTVYRGEYVATSSGTSFFIPIGSTVNASNSMALITGYRSTSTATTEYDNFLMRASVYNSTHLRVQRLAAGTNVVISWEVVEWNLSKIDSFQNGSTTVVGSTHVESNHLQVPLSESVDVSDSIMIFQIDTSSNGLDQVAVAGYLSAADQIDFYASSVGTTADYAGNRNVNWYVIDFGSESGHRDRGQIDYASDANWANHNEVMTQSMDLSRSISFVSLTHDGTGTAFPRSFPNVHFSDEDTLNIYRTYNGQEAYIEWQVLELPYANNSDVPQFFNPGVNQTYARLNETVRINITINDSSDEITYANGIISGKAYNFTNNSQEWYYDWFCNESMVVNFTWILAKEDGTPNQWNATNVTDSAFICDPITPSIKFSSLTKANNAFTNASSYYVSVNASDSNFANISYEIHNASGLVNRTTYTSLIQNITFYGLVTGNYTYNVTIYDLARQVNFTETRLISVDIDNPLIEYTTGTELNDSVIAGESVFVNVSVVEVNEANITFTLYNDAMGIERQNVYSTPQRELSFDNLYDGVFYYEVKIVDLVGRQNSTDLRKITLDNSFPVIDFASPTKPDTFNSSVNWTFINISASVGSEANVTFRLYNLTHSLINSSVFYTPVRKINFTNLTDGDYYYNVTMFDLVGRNDSTETRMIRIDTLKPFVDYGSGVEPYGANVSKNWVFVNVSASDLYLKNYSFQIFNSSGLVNRSWKTHPLTDINFTNLADGLYYYNATAYDFAGNNNSTSTYQITLDRTSPNATLLEPVNYTVTNVTSQNLTVNVTDNIGLANVTLQIYNSTNNLINTTTVVISGGTNAIVGVIYEFLYDGIFKWFYWAVDIAGNTYASGNNTLIIDSVFPLIDYTTGTSPNDQNYDRNWIFINVSIVEDNFANLTFTIEGPSNQEITFTDATREYNFTGLPDGAYLYSATVYDKAGQGNSTSIRLIGLDTTAPFISIDEPTARIYATNESLDLRHTALDNFIGLDSCWWHNETATINITVPCNSDTTFDTTEGIHTITFYANDSFGHVSSDNVTFSVSLTGPAVVLTAPDNETFYDTASNITFNYTAYDPDLVETCSLWGSWNGGWHLNQTDYDWFFILFENFTEDFEAYTPGEDVFELNWSNVLGDQCSWWANSGSTGSTGTGPSIDNTLGTGAGVYVFMETSTSAQAPADDFCGTTGNEAFLESDPLDADRYDFNLSFYYHMYGGTGMGSLHVDVYNGSWQTDVWSISGQQNTGETDPYNYQELDLSNFDGTIRIRFRATRGNNYDSDIALDDILVNYTGPENKDEGNFTVPLSAEGTYIWSVACNDTVGYTSFALENYTIILDTTTPQIQFVPLTADNNSNYSRNWIFANVSVIESNEKNITFRLYNSMHTLVNSSNFSSPVRQFNWTNLTGGFYYYNVSVVDGASRVNTTQTRKIAIDYTNPWGNLTVPLNNSYVNVTSQNLTLNATDNVYLKNATLYIYNQTGDLINTTNVVIEGGTKALLGVIYEFLYDGIFKWFYVITDIAGNTFMTENSTLTIDTVYPMIEYVYPTEIDSENVSRDWIFVNVSVVETNLANVTFNLTGPMTSLVTYSDGTTEHNFTSLIDGLYRYNVTVYDKAGQKNYTETRSITLETIAPIVTIVNPQIQNYSFGPINFNVSLNEVGDCNLSIDGGVTNYTMSTADNLNFGYVNSTIQHGQYVVNYYCADIYNNLNYSASRNFGVDANAPQIIFVPSTAANNSYIAIYWIYANVSVVEDDEKNITFTIDGPENYMNTYTYARRDINWTNLDDGLYRYNVSVYDVAGNYNISETRVLTLDNLKPVVDFGYGTSPADSYFMRSWVFVNASVVEINTANITFQLYNYLGQLINTTIRNMENSSVNNTINFSVPSDNEYYYNFTVFDKAGNSQNSSQRMVTVDTDAPDISFGGGTALTGTSFERNYIYADVVVFEPYFMNITYRLYNLSGLVNESGFTSLVTSLNWTGLQSDNKTYWYNVSAYDLAGNLNYTETRVINLTDETPPFLNITAPENQTYSTNVSIPLRYNVSDYNLDSCWYNLNGGQNYSVPGCVWTTIDVADMQTHTLYMFANDTLGQESSDNVTFIANTSYINLPDYIVQRGTISVDGSQDVPIEEVPPTKSFILLTSRSSDAGPDSLLVTSDFSGTDTITLENYAAGGGATVDWEVVSGPAITVQRNQESFITTDSSITVNIGTVDLSQSFIIVNSRLNDGDGANNAEGFWDCGFTSTTQFVCNRGATGTAGVLSWQVVSWSGTTVRRGSASLSGTSTSAGFTNVDPKKSFLIFSNSLSGDNSIQDIFTRGYLTSGTSATFERWANGGTVSIDWFVVYAPFFEVDNDTFVHSTSASPQYDTMTRRSLINTSKSFNIHSHENEGTGTAFSNGFVTQKIENETTITIQKGTASNAGTTNWFAIEIVDIDDPVVTLLYPGNDTNFTSYDISSFNYSVSDDSSVTNCSLYGNWSLSGWHENQTTGPVTRDVMQYFSGVTVENDSYYIWNVLCTDLYGNNGSALVNYTFSAFLPPTELVILGINQTDSSGTGNVTLFWNSSNHTTEYRIYATEDLSSPFTLYDTTTELQYIDVNASDVRRRFYNVSAANPGSENNSADIYGKTVYYLKRVPNVNTRNRIGFYLLSNFTNANETLSDMTNVTAITMFNNSYQRRVTCNNFSCPDYPLCTDTNCNFNLTRGIGYEVYLNSSAPTEVNWSSVGLVDVAVNVSLVKNVTSFGKNWISMYANTTLADAFDLILDVPSADAVTYWNESEQSSRGLIISPFPWVPYLGRNFEIEPEYGYEVSVTASNNWTQV